MKKYFFLALFLLIADQASKWFFQERTVDWTLLSFHSVTNTGALFGMFQGWNILFIALSVLALIGAWFFLREEPFVLSLFIVGIVGNMIDRIIFGHVRDFIDVGFWPVFNVADACLTIGILVLLFSSMRTSPKKH